jgi:3-oxoadipate enol-lactonase
MARIEVAPGLSLQCDVDDYLWPWTKATPVLMVHGFSRNASVWTRWVPFVAERHRVYRLELRGCGRSDVPDADYKFTLELAFHDLLAVMDSLGLERVHYVGESSSGTFGAAFAAAHPGRVASLVLNETSPQIRWSTNVEPEFATTETRSDIIRREGVGGWCRSTIGHRVDLNRASPELAEWYISEMGKTPKHVGIAMFECFSQIDLGPLLAKIQAPVLVIRGEKMNEKSFADQDVMLKTIPNARALTIPNVSYGSYTIEAEQADLAATKFWAEIDRLAGPDGNQEAGGEKTDRGY